MNSTPAAELAHVERRAAGLGRIVGSPAMIRATGNERRILAGRERWLGTALAFHAAG